ncbi:LysM repeat protein [Anaerosolibacter carboniphilus]|uniref:LysM repeat protein n=1 Tax=Anaerosolibacter carboniphilus TaxID=1417629 RepID=A0A841L137_9FIRM|nr:LysM repeat protein [Anaerosolibacter carboniphilus]
MSISLHRHQCSPNTTPYIIQEGDNLFKIARTFNTSALLIIKANPHINPYTLFVGQKLCIPKR